MKDPPHQDEPATEQEQPQRKQGQKRAASERVDRTAKKGSLNPLDTDDIPMEEAASPADQQALSAGAVKPETPAKVRRLLHACTHTHQDQL